MSSDYNNLISTNMADFDARLTQLKGYGEDQMIKFENKFNSALRKISSNYDDRFETVEQHKIKSLERRITQNEDTMRQQVEQNDFFARTLTDKFNTIGNFKSKCEFT